MTTATPVIPERPIIFSAPMVRAILAGCKTQTRRLIKPQPDWIRPADGGTGVWHGYCGSGPDGGVRCPYGVPGHLLWVRETWAQAVEAGNRQVCYAADGRWGSTMATGGIVWHGWTAGVTSRERPDWQDLSGKWVGRSYFARWKSPIHMPRAASRIVLEITDVRVQHLQDITEEDAIAEGAQCAGFPASFTNRGAFSKLWNKINGDGSWESDPWVWAVSFRRVEA